MKNTKEQKEKERIIKLEAHNKEHHQIAKNLIKDIFENYNGVKTLAAKQILYHLMVLPLANFNDEYFSECYGYNLEYRDNSVGITSYLINKPTTSEDYEEIKDALSELCDIHYEVKTKGYESYYSFSSFASAEIKDVFDKKFIFIQLNIPSILWQEISKYSLSEKGSFYISSHKNIMNTKIIKHNH